MSYIILSVLLLTELGSTCYSLSTKSNQQKLKNYIRISFLLLFLFLTALSIIQWSFRWVLLAVLLVCLGGCSLYSLLRRKEETKSPRRWVIVLKCIGLMLVYSISMIPALIFPQYRQPEVSGPYKVRTVTESYIDHNRMETFSHKNEKREVNVEFWYPEHAKGTYPLIIFSHGAFGIKTSNTSTFEELASNGYVVCSIDHPYHAMFTKDSKGRITTADPSFIREVEDANNDVYDGKTEYRIEKKWLKLRTKDMNFVIDTIKAKTKNKTGAKDLSNVYTLIDTTKIGVMGHSLGGAASVQIGRERTDVGAVVNLDADLLGEYVGWKDGKWLVNHKVYSLPLLSIYSDDMKRLYDQIKDPAIEIPQRLISATAPCAYEVYIKGTNHMSLTDLPLVSPLMVSLISDSVNKCGKNQKADKYQVIERMNHLVLDFFNVYLKKEGKFQPDEIN